MYKTWPIRNSLITLDDMLVLNSTVDDFAVFLVVLGLCYFQNSHKLLFVAFHSPHLNLIRVVVFCALRNRKSFKIFLTSSVTAQIFMFPDMFYIPFYTLVVVNTTIKNRFEFNSTVCLTQID